MFVEYHLNRNGSPILVTLVAFWHFAVVRQEVLSPSIAFTSVSPLNVFLSILLTWNTRLLV